MRDVPWLSDREQRAWRLFLRFRRTFFDRLSDDLSAHGLDFAQYEVLALLSEAPESQLRMTELANLIVSQRSRLTYQIDQMVLRGLVERVKCETDRRGSFAHLTELGWETVRTLAPVHLAGVRENLFDVLSPEELSAFTTMLERALQRLDTRETPVEPELSAASD